MKSRDIRKALLQKGFKISNSDHTFYTFYYRGKKTNIFTKISHGETDISVSLISKMARQIKLSKNEFKSFVDCPLTAELYLEHLTANSFIQV
jgi:predicted RNA binding protein YcfA (HicA-like mRNA interferase family)